MRNRRHIPTLILSAVLSVILAGCGGYPSGSSESPLSPAEFVEIVVEIRESEREVADEDSAAQLFAERRREVLERHDTSEEELRAFLVANAENLALLEQVWDTINARLTFTPPGLDTIGEGEFTPENVAPQEPGEEEVEDAPDPRRRVLPPPRDSERLPVIR